MKIVEKTITTKELKEMSKKMQYGLVKAVVDIEKEILAVDAEMHADLEEFLLEQESEQKDLWGINLYPDNFGNLNFIEFDSMINLRPSAGNYSRSIEDQKIQTKIRSIVSKRVVP